MAIESDGEYHAVSKHKSHKKKSTSSKSRRNREEPESCIDDLMPKKMKRKKSRSKSREKVQRKDREKSRSNSKEKAHSRCRKKSRSNSREKKRRKYREKSRSRSREKYLTKCREKSRSESRERQRYGKWSEDLDKPRQKEDEERQNRYDNSDYSMERKESRRRRSSDEYEKDRDSFDNNYYRKSLKYNDRDNEYRQDRKRSSENKKFYSDSERGSDVQQINSKRKLVSDTGIEDDYPEGRRTKSFNIGDQNESSDNAESKTLDSSKATDTSEPLSKREKIVNVNLRSGGTYIPPARLKMMQEQIKDKNSEQFQRIAWEALKKSIVGMTNKVNSSNLTDIVRELIQENIIRGRGILARAVMQAQTASPTFTKVYAALVAIINTKFPAIGELILKRLIIQYRRAFHRNDKNVCISAARFLAHLLNQEVVHEVLILEMIVHLLENPTDDSIEIAVATLKECGKKIQQISNRAFRAVTDRIRNVHHDKQVNSRIQYIIDVFFAVVKDGFKDFEPVPKELDVVSDDQKNTHLMNLDDDLNSEDILNVFKYDPEYVENEEKYKSLVKEILGDSEDEGSEDDSDDEDADEEEDDAKEEEKQEIVDMTETKLVCLRRKIYLTIQSSMTFEECAHKLIKLEFKGGEILEMCYMILDCCAQQRTYEKFFGLLAQRFCNLSKTYVEPFTEIFQNSYNTIHRLETNKIRNVAKFFAHLLYTDAISWTVLGIIKLNEEDTNSSSRIFIKILFQELCEYMGLPKLNERVKDPTLQEAFEGLFPTDYPNNTRFAINFFTSIGLGGLTDDLREHLKHLPKKPVARVSQDEEKSSSSSSSSASSSSSTSSSSSSSSSSESDSD